jgi:hypothetical protein
MQNDHDIELAITGLLKDHRKVLIGKIPRNYTVEARSITNYGLVIRSKLSGVDKEINAKLEGFLRPLLPLAREIKGRACILRIAIFSHSFTTTAMLNSRGLSILAKFNAGLEISVYPTQEETRTKAGRHKPKH